MTSASFKFEKFAQEHYDTYNAWFADRELRTAIDGIDETWLEDVLSDTSGSEIAVSIDQKLIGVVGITNPTSVINHYVITNIAVDPSQKNKGLGSQILKALMDRSPLKQGEFWVSFVEPYNLNGQRFFEKNGWSRTVEKDTMIKYAYAN